MEEILKRPDYGPYICGAFFCEKILKENDGVLSAIRIIDRLTFHGQTNDVTEGMLPQTYDLDLLIILKTGEASGATTVKIEGQKPMPPHLRPIEQSIHLEQPSSKGANLQIHLRFEFDQPGVWWFKILVNGFERTRVPLEIIWLPQPKRQG